MILKDIIVEYFRFMNMKICHKNIYRKEKKKK